MIDQPRPVEDAVVEMLQGGFLVEATELILEHGLDRYEMLALAGFEPDEEGEDYE